MAASVARAATSLGVTPAGIVRLDRAHALAMEVRAERMADEHHPLYLHPGRTVLVLLRDVGVTDPVVLCAAALVESEDDSVRPSAQRIRREVGDDVGDLAASVPLPGSHTLVEDLVTGSERVRLVALAERLDHVRHAHLVDAPAEWRRAVHAQAEAAYLPVAERTHARLADRYRHWCAAFARRLERE
jgi:(p)ppGpp synthase/HD superfamily hydrolase